MPGIAVVAGHRAEPECERQLRTMLDTMRHESAYASGVAFVPDLGVWAGWLAHPGSFAHTVSTYRHTDGSMVFFSGECFPTPDGADAAVVADPGRFAAWLIVGSRREGPLFLKRLNGLFSGLVIDRTARRCLLLNDRFGCERLHVHESDGEALVASEAKALLRVHADLRVFEPDSVAQYLAYGSVPGGRTLFREVDLLPAASAREVGPRGLGSPRRYFSPEEWVSQPALSEQEFQDALSELMGVLVPRYLQGSRPVGISITAGLDTRMIMASLPEVRPAAVCYTYAGLEGETLDARLGARVANACGYPHHLLRIGPDFLRDYPTHVDKTVYVTDGCAGPLEAHEMYLTRLAAQLSSVRVTGNYGSEVLRGMSTFKRRDLRAEMMSPSLAASVASVVRPIDDRHPVYQAAFQEIPWHLFGMLAAAKSALVVRTPYMDNELVRLAFRAPAQARQGASASLRLVRERSPALASIPTDQGRVPAERYALRGLARTAGAAATFKLDYWHKEGLPTALSWMGPVLGLLAAKGLLGQHKYLPYRAWFGGDLRAHVLDVLTDPQTTRSPFWSATGLRRVAEDHFSGRRNSTREIHAVLALEAVERTLIKQQYNA